MCDQEMKSLGDTVYDTRNFDLTDWKKAMGRTAAIEITCNEVGYVPP